MAAAPAQAGALSDYCERHTERSPAQHDKLLRFAEAIKAELERSGATVALVSRSGLDLARFDLRYSHAGLSLKASAETRWAVRQLYYACDERRPRLFDQGLAAFVLGTEEGTTGHVSLLLLPDSAAQALEATALDNRAALSLLGARYSANAFPFSDRYQNCNQWLAELLALAWGGLAPVSGQARAAAQQWLAGAGYRPSVVEVGWHTLMWAARAHWVPWIHADDHPAEDLEALRFRVSLPDSLEAFARALHPRARRVEFCHDWHRIVVRRGAEAALDAACTPAAGDEVIEFD